MLVLLASCVLSLSVSTHALPVTTLQAPPISSFALSFAFLPFPVLVLLKYTYLWYRRVQSIHAGDTQDNKSASMSGSSTSGLSLGKRPFQTGYLVGFLGSPEWETRIKCRRDRLERQARNRSRTGSKPSSISAILYPRTVDGSTNTSRGGTKNSCRRYRSQSRSRTASASYLDMSSPLPHLDITSCATVHPSSPPCTPMLPHPPAAYIPALRSPTLMQIMEPVLSSWYGEPGMHQEKSTSSGGNSNGDQSGIRSSSPTPPFETPPTSPNTPSVPDVAQFSLSVAFSSSQVQASSSLTFSVFEAPSVPVPAPVYSPNRPRSCGAHPEQWGANGECTSVKYLQSPTHRSPPVTPNILELVAVVRNERKPLALTTRPLNVTSKPKIAISPPSLSISPHVLGRQKRVQQQRRKSCSPTIGPSPLRNAVVLDSTSFTASVSTPTMGTVIKMENSLSGSTSGTWQLEDLVRDGQLDVDAVSAVLGLGLMMGSDDGDADARIITSTLDAEVGHYDQIMTGYYDDAEKSLNMGWGRARELGASLQIRVPGSQLFAIPEETDDECASARVSAASACDIDLRLLGLEQEQLDLGDEALWENVWEEEQSWTESVSIRESIGLAW